ncbi:hypothetical protein EUGRSUZ_J00600 [Eucalyptus grandis]|uniref:Uncharacterized protein n=2 Tax=Eucalyptus grandis TaxID=71139 RepID=A0ACC3J4F6_EUCGR|nr:hypothetical protein EUGRSUZ_J00600 [Eucalyptus grandis]
MPCLNSSMAFSLSSAPSFPCSTPCANPGRLICSSLVVRCEADGSSAAAARSKLEVGSPVIMTEAPTMIKTAASVPCLRINSGLVKPGDVGRYNRVEEAEGRMGGPSRDRDLPHRRQVL